MSVADAGIYSRALTAQEVTARYARSFADRSTEQVSFTPTSPAEGSELTSPTTLAGTLENPELLAARSPTPWTAPRSRSGRRWALG